MKNSKTMPSPLAALRTVALAAFVMLLAGCADDGTTPVEPGSRPQMLVVANSIRATKLSSSHTNSCAIVRDGTVRCWGGTDHRVPMDPPVNLGAVKDVSAGLNVNCAVKTNGTPVCWGYYAEYMVPPADLALLKKLRSASLTPA